MKNLKNFYVYLLGFTMFFVALATTSCNNNKSTDDDEEDENASKSQNDKKNVQQLPIGGLKTKDNDQNKGSKVEEEAGKNAKLVTMFEGANNSRDPKDAGTDSSINDKILELFKNPEILKTLGIDKNNKGEKGTPGASNQEQPNNIKNYSTKYLQEPNNNNVPPSVIPPAPNPKNKPKPPVIIPPALNPKNKPKPPVIPPASNPKNKPKPPVIPTPPQDDNEVPNIMECTIFPTKDPVQVQNTSFYGIKHFICYEVSKGITDFSVVYCENEKETNPLYRASKYVSKVDKDGIHTNLCIFILLEKDKTFWLYPILEVSACSKDELKLENVGKCKNLRINNIFYNADLTCGQDIKKFLKFINIDVDNINNIGISSILQISRFILSVLELKPASDSTGGMGSIIGGIGGNKKNKQPKKPDAGGIVIDDTDNDNDNDDIDITGGDIKKDKQQRPKKPDNSGSHDNMDIIDTEKDEQQPKKPGTGGIGIIGNTGGNDDDDDSDDDSDIIDDKNPKKPAIGPNIVGGGSSHDNDNKNTNIFSKFMKKKKDKKDKTNPGDCIIQ